MLVAGEVGGERVTAAEMAPAPCSTRPTTTVCTSWAMAATTLPITNSSRPTTITGLRPKRSEAAPKGICRKAWVRPGADGHADQCGIVAAGHAVGVDRKHRQDQEQAEHAQREDRRQRNSARRSAGLILSLSEEAMKRAAWGGAEAYINRLPKPERPMDAIRIRGARTHNLKNIALDIPRNRLTVITGLSGSGKSSWPSTPSTPRASAAMWNRCRPTRGSFLQLMEKPDVD